ncbi:chemotaxis protein CheB [Massilia psychrophila]|uniref:protein-glutamate methylesterase n=1 Tax=Massilia psychrophila TaxID=1603353 RepID=A0A2G8T199_9BURK|nr:chemotaxis protein CheB [Massilia psychrophila]PIL39752.1 chemotaxis protein CheB [Massilia psychrophila]GGE63498.1 chemotaxis protein CheB [Massilia psychrophila]
MITPLWFTPALAARRPQALIVAGSAGGVEALMTLLSAVPSGLQVPVICMLHLPANRDSRLADLFDERLPVPVREAADKQAIAAGTVYFAGSGYHLSVEQDRSFSLSCEAPVHFARPAIDVLMTSAADAYGDELAAILLTGANRDGAAGMAYVHAKGGLTVVQEPLDAQVATMPQAAIDACAPDLVLPLAAIRELLQLLLEKK